jgi:hypothetical protein
MKSTNGKRATLKNLANSATIQRTHRGEHGMTSITMVTSSGCVMNRGTAIHDGTEEPTQCINYLLKHIPGILSSALKSSPQISAG